MADPRIVHAGVWAVAFVGQVAQVVFSKNRLELGVEYFSIAGAVTFEKSVMVFQWRDTCQFLALALTVWHRLR